MGELVQPRPTITVEKPTEADFREALMGSNGNPSYEDQFGITAAATGSVGVTQPSLAELELQAQLALARATNPLAFAGQGGEQATDPNSEVEKWKKLYGQSENEKGEARRREAELNDAFNALMTQFEQMQAQAAMPNPAQWSVPQMPPQFSQPYGQPQFSNPFADIKDDDIVDGKTVKTLVERAANTVAGYAELQAKTNSDRLAILERQLLSQAQAASGISKIDEFRIAAKNPWINRLAPGERIAALQSLKSVEVATQPANGNGSTVPQPPASAQNRILNRVTYIEGSNPNVPDDTQAAFEAAKQRDYALAMNLPADTGERARALRAFGNKYGINLGQNPSDLAR